MSPSKDDLTERVAKLESYTNTLHMVLDHFVERLRKVETVTGQDDEGFAHSLQWRAQLEASLAKMMLEQDWNWQESDDQTERAKGDVSYKRILKLSEMLPVDVMLKLWASAEIPTDLPLIWSEGTPTHEAVSDTIKDQSTKRLLKTLKEIEKYD